MTSFPSAACVVAAALAVPGCGSDSPPRVDMPTVRDSAGVLISENMDSFGDETPTWSVNPDPALTIGADLEAAPEYQLAYVRGALRTLDGGVVVADGGDANVLREYGPSGRYVATWGREGDGPGEFRDLSEIHRWRADSVVAWDMLARRITVFDSEGDVGRTSAVAGFDNAGSLDAALAGERLVFGRITNFDLGALLGAGGGYRRERQAFEIRDGTGEAIALLGPYPHDEYFIDAASGRLSVRSLAYSRRVVTGIWKDLVVVGPNDTYELRAYAGDGSLRQIVQLDRVPKAVADADRRAWLEEHESTGRGRGDADVPMASHLPMFDKVIGDEGGHLWVRDYDMPGDDPVPWTVFDSLGRRVARSEMPDNLEVWEIGEDYVVASRVDELGIHSVVVLTLHRSGGPG